MYTPALKLLYPSFARRSMPHFRRVCNNNNNNNNNNLFTYNAQVSTYIFTCAELNSLKQLITSI